jgi:hypothetical protein
MRYKAIYLGLTPRNKSLFHQVNIVLEAYKFALDIPSA